MLKRDPNTLEGEVAIAFKSLEEIYQLSWINGRITNDTLLKAYRRQSLTS
jgi:hypothetical protein